VRTLKERIGINTSKQAVWDVMADFGNASVWAPGMRRSGLWGKVKAGVGMHRIMQHTWGFIIEEVVTQWTEGTGYSFELVRAPFPMCSVCETWVLNDDDSQAVLSITVSYGMRLGFIGALLDAVLVRFVVAREMRLGICGLKHHVEKTFAKNLSNIQPASSVADMPGD
jgi:hypothetical protein